jgi:hypothetical protein
MPASIRNTVFALVVLNTLAAAPARAVVLSYADDKTGFVAAGATSIGALPSSGGSGTVVGPVTFTNGGGGAAIAIGTWSNEITGFDLAISGPENFNLAIAGGTYGIGFDMHEPTTPGVGVAFGCKHSNVRRLAVHDRDFRRSDLTRQLHLQRAQRHQHRGRRTARLLRRALEPVVRPGPSARPERQHRQRVLRRLPDQRDRVASARTARRGVVCARLGRVTGPAPTRRLTAAQVASCHLRLRSGRQRKAPYWKFIADCDCKTGVFYRLAGHLHQHRRAKCPEAAQDQRPLLAGLDRSVVNDQRPR